jgi:hypothetical protein
MKKDASRFSPKGVLFHRTFFTAPPMCEDRGCVMNENVRKLKNSMEQRIVGKGDVIDKVIIAANPSTIPALNSLRVILFHTPYRVSYTRILPSPEV